MKYIKLFLFSLAFGFIVMIPKDTFALTTYTERFYDQEFDVSQATNYWQVITSTFNNNWANGGGGYIRFNFSITKTYGNSTSMTLAPAAVIVQNKLGNEFICDIGSVSVNNSTWNTQTYSAVCPVQFYNGAGLDKIVINFLRGSGDNSTYHGWFDGRVTFEVPQFINVPDTSANDNNNTNRVIAEQQKILQEQQKTTQATKDIDNTLKDNNISGAETDADSLVNNPVFQDSTGLNNIISLPLDFINTIGNSCTPINLTIPFINTNITLPCFSSVLSSKVPTIYNLLVIVINGFILYRCCLDIYGIVKNAKNPNNDRIEVLDL